MLLVNVGTHILNVEQALAFIDGDDTITVVFGPDGGADGERYTITLDGDEADRMRTWLQRNAEGVRGTGQTGFTIDSAETSEAE